jgi:peptidoglycan L-alanyl-D-glutamate endopeptidase CwlK
MSAGIDFPTDALVHNSLVLLAPKMASAVQLAMRDANDAGMNAIVYESYRTDALQRIYYARGRTVKPPMRPVTNAKNNLYSWHGYGLAVDVIHATLRWDAPFEWFEELAGHFIAAGCKWGGRWKRADLPHFQWGRCRVSPSDRARELLRDGGLPAVWKVVGAAA